MMNRVMKYGMGVAIGGLLYLGFGVANATSDDQEYNLTSEIKSGQKRKCAYELSVAGEVKVVTFGRHPLMKFSSKVVRTINDEVLEANADADGKTKTLKLKREYASSVLTVLEPVKPSDNDAMKPGPEETQTVTKPDALDNKTFEISYQIEQGLSITPVITSELKNEGEQKEPLKTDVKPLIILHDGDFALLMPDKKVKVGAEWEVKSDVLAQVLSLKDGRPIRYVHKSPQVGMRFELHDTTAVKCAFTEVTKMDSADCAKIKITGKIRAIQDGMLYTEINLDGFILIDIKDGAVRQVEINGDMRMQGQYPERPTDKGMVLKCKVEGTGKLSLISK